MDSIQLGGVLVSVSKIGLLQSFLCFSLSGGLNFTLDHFNFLSIFDLYNFVVLFFLK